MEELIKSTQKIEDIELIRAKNQVKSSLIMSLENTNSRCQKLGNNILNHNKIISNKDIINKINNINIDELINYSSNLIKQKPTFTAIGKIENIIDYKEINF
jgi:predicted Zn-dependent peptidase